MATSEELNRLVTRGELDQMIETRIRKILSEDTERGRKLRALIDAAGDGS